MRRRLSRSVVLALLLGLGFVFTGAGPPDGTVVLEDFGEVSRWKAVPSDGVSLSLAADAGFRGRALSMDLVAGIPDSWISAPGGVAVRGLRTRYGSLDYSLVRSGSETRMNLSGDLAVPPGGLVLSLPEKLAPRDSKATVNGRAAAVVSGEVVIRELPARVIVR